MAEAFRVEALVEKAFGSGPTQGAKTERQGERFGQVGQDVFELAVGDREDARERRVAVGVGGVAGEQVVLLFLISM